MELLDGVGTRKKIKNRDMFGLLLNSFSFESIQIGPIDVEGTLDISNSD